jgi:glycerol-3-phosphate dehydrogenase
VTRAVVPLAVLALTVGGAGCGDDSEEFKEDYNRVVRPLSALGDEVAASLAGAEGESDRAIARQFDKLADRSERARRQLERLDPPEDAQEQFDELLARLKQGIVDLRAVARAAREGDPAEAEEATEALVETGERLRQAEDEFREAVE